MDTHTHSEPTYADHQYVGVCVECHGSVWRNRHVYHYKHSDSTQLMHNKCHQRSLRRDKQQHAYYEHIQQAIHTPADTAQQTTLVLTLTQQSQLYVYVAFLMHRTYKDYALTHYFYTGQPVVPKQTYSIYINKICTAVEQVYNNEQQQIYQTIQNSTGKLNIASDCSWSHHNYHSNAGFYTCMNTDTQQIITTIIKFKPSVIHTSPTKLVYIAGNYDPSLSSQAMEGIAFDELVYSLQQNNILDKIDTWTTDMHTLVSGRLDRMNNITHLLDPSHKYKALRKLLKNNLVSIARDTIPTHRLPRRYTEKYKHIASQTAYYFLHSIHQAKALYTDDMHIKAEYMYRVKCLLLHALYANCPSICVCQSNIQNYTEYIGNIDIHTYDERLNNEWLLANSVASTASTHTITHAQTHTNIQRQQWLDKNDILDAKCIPVYTNIINTLTRPDIIQKFVHKYTTSHIESFHSLIRSIINVRYEYRKRYRYYIMLGVIRHNYQYDTCKYFELIFNKLSIPFTPYTQQVIHHMLDTHTRANTQHS